MKDPQKLQETYTDLLDQRADPQHIQLIQQLDQLANKPQPPAHLNWATIKDQYNKQSEDRQPLQLVSSMNIASKPSPEKKRSMLRYGISLLAATLVIGLLLGSLIFATNHLWGNGGIGADIHMQLTAAENGGTPSRAAMEKALTILSARFNQFGLKGSHVSLGGPATILVTLPSFGDNQQRAVDKLLEPGTLSFWDTGPDGVLAQGATFNSADYAQYNSDGKPPFTNQDFKPDAFDIVQDTTTQNYGIIFEVQNNSSSRFQQFTSQHIGHALTITLDGKVLMSAIINSTISNHGEIAGKYTQQQAQILIATLKSGVLPVELTKLP